jgi:hypothetical protein
MIVNINELQCMLGRASTLLWFLPVRFSKYKMKRANLSLLDMATIFMPQGPVVESWVSLTLG